VSGTPVDDDAPSWVVSPAPPASSPPMAAVPARLWLLVPLTALLAAAEVVHVATRDELVAGLRGFLVVVVGVQVPLAYLVVRRSAGAALATLVYQGTTVVAALVGGFGELRLALAAGAAVGMALLASSLHAFPTPTLPPLPPLERP
jgi:hypothetical protein